MWLLFCQISGSLFRYESRICRMLKKLFVLQETNREMVFLGNSGGSIEILFDTSSSSFSCSIACSMVLFSTTSTLMLKNVRTTSCSLKYHKCLGSFFNAPLTEGMEDLCRIYSRFKSVKEALVSRQNLNQDFTQKKIPNRLHGSVSGFKGDFQKS